MLRARDFILMFDRLAGDERPYGYWFEESDPDSSLDFCEECAAKEAARTGSEICGGYTNQESDSPLHCHGCGKLLAYTLTPCGVSGELVHYQENGVTWPVSPDEAYYVARMLEGLPIPSQEVSSDA